MNGFIMVIIRSYDSEILLAFRLACGLSFGLGWFRIAFLTNIFLPHFKNIFISFYISEIIQEIIQKLQYHSPATTFVSINACTKLPFSAFPLPGCNTTSAFALAILPTLELLCPTPSKPVLEAYNRPSVCEAVTMAR